jgi:predicted DNA-binding transcriptional regulator AlpA
MAVSTEQLLIDAKKAAEILSISRAHFLSLYSSGRIGPLPVRLGKAVRWRSGELRAWVNAGCPSREKWLEVYNGETNKKI